MQTKVGLFDVKNVIVNMCIKYVIKRQDYLNMLFILFLNGLKLNFLIFQLQKTIRNILCDVFIGLDENYYVPGLNGSHPAILEFYFLTVSIPKQKANSEQKYDRNFLFFYREFRNFGVSLMRVPN